MAVSMTTLSYCDVEVNYVHLVERQLWYHSCQTDSFVFTYALSRVSGTHCHIFLVVEFFYVNV